MKQTDTLTITLTNTNAKTLVYNLASDHQGYYLIDCCRSFLGNLLFIFYWIHPIDIIKISKEEFDILSQKQSEIKPKRQSGFKRAMASIVGVVIGRTLYPLISGISFTGINLVLSLCLAILLVIIARFLYNVRIRTKVQQGLQGHLEICKVRLKPMSISFKHLIIYLILLSIVLLFIWFYWSSRAMAIWIIILPILPLYSLQSKLAFLPGTYRVERICQ